ncbi:Uma2 family endonuclease [Actinomadura fibrosa]|uniref:Uma2 family endonuclease n=1 Tax=Actinomadura fibrosa TaxID=111802 RepID=A0ABW2XH98_9ACTN|nr:Uma2 family endonuclease [Actinomadura fibrosa]
MAVMVQEPPVQEEQDALLEVFLSLDTPKGFRAELIDGEIVVTPPPVSQHEMIVGEITMQVGRDASARFHAAANKGLIMPSGGRCPSGYVIPDGTFALAELLVFKNEKPWTEPDGVAMVVEVTSRRAERDRGAKRYCYARGGIPLYLLVDREREEVTLHSKPEDGDYHQLNVMPYGKPLPIPEPFGFDLDTADFS